MAVSSVMGERVDRLLCWKVTKTNILVNSAIKSKQMTNHSVPKALTTALARLDEGENVYPTQLCNKE